MLVSYIQGAGGVGCERFDKNPSIRRLQELIEDAWDRGINEEARAETGGIIGTRKYIGTPEVLTGLAFDPYKG